MRNVAGSNQLPAEGNTREYAAFRAAYDQWFDIYGKVVNQRGEPVAGASVKAMVVDSPVHAGPPPIVVLTDASGIFSFHGLKGAEVGVDAFKEGCIRYDTTGPSSSATIDNPESTGPAQPLILTLHDPGVMEQLVHKEHQRWRLPDDGAPKLIYLDEENGKNGNHAIEFRFKSEYQQLPEEKLYDYRFDWSFEMRIPGGGFLRNNNDLKKDSYYQFDAPVTGYQDGVRYGFSHSQDREDWRKFLNDSFFVKFPDGTHGRIRFVVQGDAYRSPLLMETWYNPKPGSRNLASLYK